MTDTPDVIPRRRRRRAARYSAVLVAAGAGLAAVRPACGAGFPDLWSAVGLLLALLGLVCLYAATARVTADDHGLRSRTLLRRRSMPWSDVAELRARVQRGRHQDIHRVEVLLRDGRTRRLPLTPDGSSGGRADFDAELYGLRALHHRHGGPEPGRAPVLSHRTAGGGSAVSWILCVLLLAGAGLAAWFVPAAASTKQAWTSAVPCTADTPATERGDCLSTRRAVISGTDVGMGRQSSWLYFADGGPSERLGVSQEGARGFHPGDGVELTLWRGRVRVVAGEHHVWREHFPGAGDVAVVAAGCALAAGYPGARILLRRRSSRRLAADEVVPSALPFAAALAGTAGWLLPLCYVHPADPLGSPVALAWTASGVAATLGMLAWAWRATRVRTPGDPVMPGDAAAPGDEASPETTELFLAARFLDGTDYNPDCFGTHVVLGSGPPAVTPHSGPGRFAARRIPVERLTVTNVRRVRGGDGDGVHGNWHVAELDDAGTPVRLAAAPDDLTRILRELRRRTDPAVRPGPSGS
ncbi:PH domain-containing protein [Streptomyces sp. NBC_00178]|uniref:PH domain-containing protein n=1 Tax=Streptomyces sp. NBC_00178 TaxID=2975672 RepID=UPI002E2CD207|nr:PH domain-containing protein [Streptomyces sp. NBC_00178]